MLRLLLAQRVYQRHHPSHSEWARAHAAGTPADAAPEAPMPADELTPVPTRAAPDRDPVAAYLARLGPSHRREHQRALETVAALLSADRADSATLDWAALELAHAVTLRAWLAERYGERQQAPVCAAGLAPGVLAAGAAGPAHLPARG
jgi:hypothetical protein